MIAVPRPSRVADRIRAATSSPGISPELVAEVLGALGRALAGRPRNLGGGRRSRNVAVPTDAGPVVVKRYRSGWDDETVAYGHAILRRLVELDLPGPRLVESPDGRTIVCVGGATYAAFELVPGRGYASSWVPSRERLTLLRRAGESLGAIHEGLRGFAPEGRHHMAFASLDGPRVRDASWYAARVDELRDAGLPGAEALSTRADELVERIAELEVRLAGRHLPRTVIHGDFGLHNVVFDRVRAVPIDVELARLDHRLTDHVLIAGRFLDASPGAVDAEALGAVLAAATRVWPLTDEERDGVDDAWRYQQLTSTVRSWWSATTGRDPASRVALARRSLARVGSLEEHTGVRDVLGGRVEIGSDRVAR